MRRARRLTAALATGLLLPLALAGCIDPIDLDVGEAERRLVVEGTVREGPGPHAVQLRWSAAFTQGTSAIREPATGAQVRITEEGGPTVPLAEASPGVYRTAPGALTGTTGRAYRLEVTLRDGTEYASPYEPMAAPRAIAGVRATIEPSIRVVGGVTVETPQVVLLVDAEREPGTPSFYRWHWRGAYAATVCTDETCDAAFRCYFEEGSRSPALLGDDLRVTGATLANQRIGEFVLGQENLRKFGLNFYMEVEQQSLTEPAYAFWSRIGAMQGGIGGLFDPPAEAIIGNVAQAGDPLAYALGHFTVAHTTRERVCLHRSQFPDWPQVGTPVLYGPSCTAFGATHVPPPNFYEVCPR